MRRRRLQVVARANRSCYGLAAGIFTKNLDTANYLSRALRVGTVWINTFDNFDASIPFGEAAALKRPAMACPCALPRATFRACLLRTGPTTVLGAPNTCLPFMCAGGYKMSGVGREHGEYALENFTQVRA